MRCAAPLEAHVGTVSPRADLSRVSRFFYYSHPLLYAGAAGQRMPPKFSFFPPHISLLPGVAGRRVEQPCRVSFSRTCFSFSTRCGGPKEPTCRLKVSVFHPTLHCYSGVAGRRVEQPCRVSFGPDLFLFPQGVAGRRVHRFRRVGVCRRPVGHPRTQQLSRTAHRFDTGSKRGTRRTVP